MTNNQFDQLIRINQKLAEALVEVSHWMKANKKVMEEVKNLLEDIAGDINSGESWKNN